MSLAAFSWTNRARPVIELGIGDSRAFTSGIWDRSRWDTAPAYWSGTEPEWHDISCDVISSRAEYGRRAVTDRFVAGAATVVVNNATGWADPNTADPPGALTIRPGRPIRVSVDHVVYGRRVLFRGFVDAMTPVYSPTSVDTVELSCIDALGEVNRAKLKPVAIPVGDGEGASTRIERILDAVGWAPRDVSPSAETLIATDLGGQVADLLGVTADSAGGAVFGDYNGRVAFRGRDWQAYVPDAPVDGTIGNLAGDVCPVGWERPFDRADIATRAIIGRDLETAVVVDDVAGMARYGIEPFERTDLLTLRDSSLTMLANRVLRVRGVQTAPRVRSVALNARTATNVLDLMATVNVYRPSRYRCRLQYPPPRGLVFDGQYLATGVAHELTPSSWTLALNLDVAAPFAVAGGRWDSAYWDLASWTNVAALLDEARSLIGALT